MTLAPCPMPSCDGAARHVKRQAGMPGTMGHDQWHAIACAKCGITLGESDRRFRNRDDAARAWNDLAKADPALPTQLQVADALLAEVAGNFTRDDDLPNELLRRIDVYLTSEGCTE